METNMLAKAARRGMEWHGAAFEAEMPAVPHSRGLGDEDAETGMIMGTGLNPMWDKFDFASMGFELLDVADDERQPGGKTRDAHAARPLQKIPDPPRARVYRRSPSGKLIKTYDIETRDFLTLLNGRYRKPDFVKPGLPMGSVGSIVGMGASGKSTYCLQDAISISAGLNEYTPGGVLYLPTEDVWEEIGERVQRIQATFRLSDDAIKLVQKNFKLWPLNGEAPDLMEMDEETGIKPLVEAICSIASTFENPLRIIYFDTLRRFSYGDENSGGDMSRLIGVFEEICKLTGAACFFLHHSTKAAALNGQLETQQAARGSSVLTDNIRYQEYLAPMSAEDADRLGVADAFGIAKEPIGAENRGKFVQWGVSKKNYGPPATPVWLARNEHGILIPVTLARAQKNQGGRGRGYDG